MENLINQLREILNKELDTYKDMLDLTTKKKDIILSGHIKELDKVTQLEQTLILNIGKLEDIREEIVIRIKKDIGLKNDLSMTELAKHLDDKDYQDIEKIKNELLEVLNEIKDKNNLNNLLIKDSLEYINFNLNLLTNTPAENTYGNTENKGKASQNKNLFDAKI